MKKQLMTFLLCGSLFATAQQPVDYVNPFIGTSNYGTTNPVRGLSAGYDERGSFQRHGVGEEPF